MKHVIPLALKFILWSAVLLSIFAIFNVPLLLIFLIALVTTAISYILGDLFVLPRFGNFIAVIADLPLSFAIVWLFSYFLIEPTINMAYAAFFSALAIAAIEAFFHVFMQNRVLDGTVEKEVPRWFDQGQWSTEFSEEYADGKMEREKRESDDLQ